MLTSEDYWADQQYEDMFYELHGHLSGTTDADCSLCGPPETRS